MNKVILISGKSSHGKDELGRLLEKQFTKYGQKVLITHFGDPVKWFAKAYFGYDGEKNIDGRNILQYVGTTLMRSYSKFYWADIIGSFIAAVTRNNLYDVIIISDLRFYSEYEAICKYCLEEGLELFTIRINRINPDGTPYKNPQMTKEQLNHISECELDDFRADFIVENKSEMRDLEESAFTVMRQIFPNYKEFDKSND